ncbi:MAG TPA: GNAT family N-acetyltransferase [Solirubrobacteraceae bacterium]|nr:GNAT family N-acetyltransferase [Solirubrobacteraceae bacterium]
MSTPNSINVRRARSDDASAIAEIHVRSWRAAYKGVLSDELLAGLSVKEREGSWDQVLAGNDHHWLNLIAENEHGPLGFCAVTTPSWDASPDEQLAEIGALYVDPGHWRQGVGSALLGAALEELRENAWREVVLWVLPENRRALDFYAGFGFRVEEGVEKREARSDRPVIRLRAPVAR